MLQTIAATAATIVLAAMAVMQILVASGLPYGAFVYGGKHRTLPTRLRVTSVFAVVLYAAVALVLFARAGALPGQDSVFILVVTWALFAFFTFGVILNALSPSREERFTATPACLILSIASLVLALGM